MKSFNNTLFFLAIVAALSLFVLPGAEAKETKQNKVLPELIFAYPSELPIIREQSGVATIVYPVSPSDDSYMFCSVETIDGVGLWGRKSTVRRYRTMMTAGVAIDVLPGKHTVSISYNQSVWVDRKKGKYARISTNKPVDVNIKFEAGYVYRIRPIIVNNSLTGFAFDKVTDDESLLEKIATSRNNAKE